MTHDAAALIELVTPPAAMADDWRRWVDTVCLPVRLRVPGVRAGRRGRGYRNPGPQAIPDADPVDILLMELESEEIVSSREWHSAADECAEAARTLVHHPPSTDSLLARQIFSTAADYVPPGRDRAVLLHGAFYEIPSRHQDEFNDWYMTEHIPIQMAVAGYLNARRFQGVTDSDRFVALYDVVSIANTTTPAAKHAMESPWSERMRNKLATQRARRLFTVEALELQTSEHKSTK